MVTACAIIALAVLMFREAGLLTGGTTGMGFLLHYVSGWPLGTVLFAVNLPFYAFALVALGPAFTIKTFCAVAMVSAFVEVMPGLVGFRFLDPALAAVMAGLLAGVGILILIRHGASLGGITALGVFAQQRYGWRAGLVQMVVDCAILATAFLVIDPAKVGLSLLGAAALNFVIAVNHRTDRYYGV
jgi:uncharacterized membrane-anchored protein YitT (DUF2179 family)